MIIIKLLLFILGVLPIAYLLAFFSAVVFVIVVSKLIAVLGYHPEFLYVFMIGLMIFIIILIWTMIKLGKMVIKM